MVTTARKRAFFLIAITFVYIYTKKAKEEKRQHKKNANQGDPIEPKASLNTAKH